MGGLEDSPLRRLTSCDAHIAAIFGMHHEYIAYQMILSYIRSGSYHA